MAVMCDLGVAKAPRSTPCQVEDITGVPSPLNTLYGVNKGTASNDDVEAYLTGIENLIAKLRVVSETELKSCIEKQKLIVSEQIVRKRRQR